MNKQKYNRMKLPVWLLGFIAFAVFCNVAAATGVMAQTKPDTTAKAALMGSYSKLPLSFEANRGQTDKKFSSSRAGKAMACF